MYKRSIVNSLSQERSQVECTQCNVMMSSHLGSGGTVKYFHCPKCQRWSSSCYAEVFTADTKMRFRPTQHSAPSPVKTKLEQWLSALAQGNPYRVLGCTADDSMAQVRLCFRQLAKQHHPDLGGDAAQMQKINDAYTEICEQRGSSLMHAASPVSS